MADRTKEAISLHQRIHLHAQSSAVLRPRAGQGYGGSAGELKVGVAVQMGYAIE
jgi:hypothetical protein